MAGQERPATHVEPPRRRRWIAIVAFLALVAAAFVLLFTVTRYGPTDDIRGRPIGEACPRSRTEVDDPSLIKLAQSDDRCRSESIVRAWEDEGRIPEARRAVYWDFVLVAVYVAALVWACLLGLRWNRYQLAAALMAIVAVIAGALDVVENVLLLGMLDGNVRQVEASLTAGLYWTKLVLIGASAAFGLCAALGSLTRRRARDEATLPEPSLGPAAVTQAGNMPSAPPIEIAPWSWRRWLEGEDQELVVPPPVFAEAVEGRRGVCCSGGGIRSAAFNLGALQALADHREGFGDTDYLSAVSGGSYIASAVAILHNRSPDETLRPPEAPPYGRGSPEEQHLRNHSSYLAPGLRGILSLVWRVLRGLVINLSLVVLALVVVGLPVGWALAASDQEAGIPSGSEVLLTEPAELRVERGSRVRLTSERLPALDPDSVVTLASGSRLLLRSGQDVTLFRAEGETAEGRVELPTKTSMMLEPGNRLEVEGGAADIEPETDVELASGSTKTAGEGARVTFSSGSRVTVTGGRLELAQPAFLDTETGRVADACGDDPCVDRNTSDTLVVILVLLAAVALLVGLANLVLRPASEKIALALGTWSNRVLLAALAVLLLGIGLPELVTWLQDRTGAAGDLGTFGVGGVVAIVAAIVADLSAARAVAPTVAGGKVVEKARELISRAGPKVRAAFVSFVGAVVGPLAIVALFLLLIVWGARETMTVGQVTLVAGCAAALLLLWACGDLTRWSMHPFYKRRLSTAFALERYKRAGHGLALVREVGYDEEIKLSRLAGKTELVVCAAANISDLGITPPGRPVSTFTFSRTHIGGGMLGVLTPDDLESGTEYERDVSVRAAVAISGAAISPAMGKFTKRRYTFLLALANVRLGVWLPNPVIARSLPQRWCRIAFARPHYLVKELLGRTSVRDKFVYVTDGGHFENLGLVELLRRGCTDIYCFDASGGDVDSVATLGEAIAIARSDLGVEIERIANDDDRPGITTFAIRYDDSAQLGRLVVVRPVVTDDDPLDVRAYQRKDPEFPTHGTHDQLYTDEKFEAYRALGHAMADRAVTRMRALRQESLEPAR